MKIAYLLGGQQVEVHEELAKGFLVSNVYERDGEEEPIFDSRIYFVERVYETAPSEKLEEKIKKLNERVIKLYAEERQLLENKRLFESQFKSIEEDTKKQMLKVKQHEALKKLDDFIDGKITHYVVAEAYRMSLIDFKDTEVKNDDWSDRRPPGFKLLSLFGKTDGNLMWGLNQYKDGSGYYTYPVYPCISYEEAVEKLKEYLVPRLIERCDGEDFELAKKHGIEIPAEAITKRNSKLKENYEKELEEAEKKAQNAREKLAKL